MQICYFIKQHADKSIEMSAFALPSPTSSAVSKITSIISPSPTQIIQEVHILSFLSESSSTSKTTTITLNSSSLSLDMSHSQPHSTNRNQSQLIADNQINCNQINNTQMAASTDTKIESNEFNGNRLQLKHNHNNDSSDIIITEVISDRRNESSSDKLSSVASLKEYLSIDKDSKDIAMEEENSEVIKKKKLSLTLPLLNVVVTDTANSGDTDATASSVTPATHSSSKTKRFYESDDAFIQTIFSQTIKSTTATPTDDEQSYTFEDFHGIRTRGSVSSQNKTDSLNTDDTPIEKVQVRNDDDPLSISSEPVDETNKSLRTRLTIDSSSNEFDEENHREIDENSPLLDKQTFSYFHQTIDEDEPPFILSTSTHLPDAIEQEPFTNTHVLTDSQTFEAPQEASLSPLSPSNNNARESSTHLHSLIDNNNTNALSNKDGRSVETANVAATLSSYDDRSQQNNLLTSNNTSLHVSFFIY